MKRWFFIRGKSRKTAADYYGEGEE